MKQYLLEKSARMGRALREKQAEQICAYHEILIEVNKSMNLTRVPDTMAEAAYAYYVTSLPATYFVDAEGNLIAHRIGALDAELLEKGINLILE